MKIKPLLQMPRFCEIALRDVKECGSTVQLALMTSLERNLFDKQSKSSRSNFVFERDFK